MFNPGSVKRMMSINRHANQTLANHSACACHQSRGFHCKTNTKTCFGTIRTTIFYPESPDVSLYIMLNLYGCESYVLDTFWKSENFQRFFLNSISTPDRPCYSGQQHYVHSFGLRGDIDMRLWMYDSVTYLIEAFPYWFSITIWKHIRA